jgi:23S rRNA (guanosine2251-2'-O)-methyltransferase
MPKVGRIHAVREILSASPRRIRRLYILMDSGNPRLREVEALARRRGVAVQAATRAQLDRMDARHQGLLAVVSAKGFSALEAVLASSACPFLVLLDGVEDPQNLGAVIRSAEAAGADAVIIPQRRAAGLSSGVFRASAGAVEHMPVARVKNLVRAMEFLKSEGIWLAGAAAGTGRMWHDFDFTAPLGLVFGSEGKGLRPLVRRHCDAVLSLPLLGKVGSLNVSAAAAVFIYEVVRQRRLGAGV